jgi:hypothetical protein
MGRCVLCYLVGVCWEVQPNSVTHRPFPRHFVSSQEDTKCFVSRLKGDSIHICHSNKWRVQPCGMWRCVLGEYIPTFRKIVVPSPSGSNSRFFVLLDPEDEGIKKPSKRTFYSQNYEKRLLASSCPSVRQHGTTRLPRERLDKIWYLSFFRKSVEKIQVSSKSLKNNGYFTWRRFHIYDNITLISS